MEVAESVLRAGYKLDRYELLCPIASGGMATVWLARLRGKRGFEKLFAIKTIRTELVDDPRFQEMFLDEARIASGIQHPNVAQIIDLGDQEDVLFIVMEWVDGDSLAKVRKLLSKRDVKLPTGVVLRVLSDACAGLHAAHEMRDDKGELLDIVHRDVSLQNILVATSGAVKVIDFGIAKANSRKQGETRTGVVKGKVQYMAPEQVKKGRSVDRRTDVWALGACLQELVTGKLPYEGDDDVEVIRKLMTDEHPPSARGIPEPIARVLARSMAFDVEARFATAAAMQRALETAMKEMGEPTTSDDVAAFLRAELPELGQKRKAVVTKAIDEARERGTSGSGAGESGTSRVGPTAGSGARPIENTGDVAFAKTVMSGPDAAAERGASHREAAPRDMADDRAAVTEREPTFALRRRRDTPPTVVEQAARPPARAAIPDEDEEPIKIPKKSRAWLWITLLLLLGGGGAAYRWPAEARHLIAILGLGGGPVPEPETRGTSVASPSPAPSTPPLAAVAAQSSTVASPTASPSASASASPAPPGSAPSASPGNASPPSATAEHPLPDPVLHRAAWVSSTRAPQGASPGAPAWSPFEPSASAAASATAPPSASASAPEPSTSAAPVPSANAEDSSNPYNN